ncbi:MAG TPA: GGDEF domain-containing protein [Stellaceae bacterium]|nr:GGDEF domain-containing protein [Stellaceae bacterium]
MRTGASEAAGGPSGRARRGRAADVAAAAPADSPTAALPGIDQATLAPEVRTAFAQLSAEGDGLRRELAEARAQIAQLERLADEDSLTPIANRRAFVRELTRMIAFTKRYGVPSSVVYFDVNGMKQINDTHGHPAGDAALRLVAKLLLDNVRSSDIVGRLGGDEFGVILAHTNQEQANSKAKTLAEAVANAPLRWGGADIRVSAAYGVYSFSATDDAHVAIEAADRAMYRQKRVAR